MIKKTRILGKLFTPISNFGISYLGNGLSYKAEILCDNAGDQNVWVIGIFCTGGQG